jgi:hypothetical protein
MVTAAPHDYTPTTYVASDDRAGAQYKGVTTNLQWREAMLRHQIGVDAVTFPTAVYALFFIA